MADSKITALTALTAADPVNDMFPVVDVSDTSMAASGTTKRISVNNLLSSSPTASGALTVTGLVTAGSATITGDLTVDTSTLKVDSTNNRVGIGTATPSAPLNVRFDNAGASTVALFENSRSVGGSPDAAQIALSSRGYAYTVLRQNSDLGTNTIGGTLDTVLANVSTLGSGYGKLILATQSTARLSVHETSGDVSIANGNVVMATSGKGIDFSATTSGSGTMTSELLNDYEEGTWVGTLTGATTNPTVPVTATGKYTKIGRQVTVVIYFQNVSTVGASGVVAITGLPFTEDGERAVGTVALHTFDFDSGTSVYADVSGSTLFFSSQLTNAAWRDVKHNAGTGRFLRTTVTYNV
jgi:hypothetical protein